ncbi:glycosyltransferase family 1 protein [Microlunatus elymi]|uniref:Glycosyltransferase family 1 protein n=1 Tax=Microlunatus elymi TaxID=2596828 RepID=A0A516Q3W4_9ACTN|nr:glycosyltransferase [Microlunatus elymi]QDP98109.1 glycosyltransferase family 1 protein [Microlunatus elymi]
MRIAYVSETWAPSIDGVVSRLRATLAELTRRGIEVMLIVPDGHGVSEHPAGVEVVEIPSVGWQWVSGGRLFAIPLQGRVQRVLRHFAPDLVHALSPYILGRAGISAARALELPVVSSFHQDLAAVSREAGLGFMAGPIWAYFRHQHGLSDRNLVTSRAMIDLMHRQRIGSVELWPFGVDSVRFTPARRDPIARQRLFGAGSDTIALYVGRLAPEKDLRRLHRLARTPGIRLVLVGDGPQRRELERELSNSGAHFTGWLTGDDLADAYAAADVLTFPSNTETLGFALIEALASGLPVLAAASEPTAEILGGCAGGMMLRPYEWNDAASRITDLIGEDRRPAAAAAARARALAWDWASATDTLLGIYASLLRADPLRVPLA